MSRRDQVEEFMSRIAHHCWVSYQIAAGQPYEIEMSQAQLDSQKNAMKMFLEDPGMTAEKNHENWMAYKLSVGWKLGPVRDEAKKESPCLVPFADLPEIEKKKDIMDIEARRFAYKLAQDIGLAYTVSNQNCDRCERPIRGMKGGHLDTLLNVALCEACFTSNA